MNGIGRIKRGAAFVALVLGLTLGASGGLGGGGVGAGAALASTQGSGLPLPRFVSLRADEVRMRAGPSVRYPVEWEYHKRLLPVEVIAEFDTWRKVRDWRGAQGWIHQSMLSGTRTMLVTGKTRTLRRDADTRAEPVAILEPGVLGRILECPTDGVWCRIEVQGLQGWLRRMEFWGAYPQEAVK